MRAALTILISLALLACIGCRTIKYVSPSGETLTHRSFGTKTEIASLDLIATNNVRGISLRGYSQDQVEAIRVAVEVAVQTAMEIFFKEMGIPTLPAAPTLEAGTK